MLDFACVSEMTEIEPYQPTMDMHMPVPFFAFSFNPGIFRECRGEATVIAP